jgi:hypothetical protein
MRGHMRIQARAATDPAAINMRAAHMHRAAAHTHSAAATEVRAAAKMSSAATATTEVSTATPTAEVTAATATATAADMAATAATAASRVSRSRQTKGKAYCGRACRDFPHGMPSSSGPNAGNQRQIARSVPADAKLAMLQCTHRHCALRALFYMCLS